MTTQIDIPEAWQPPTPGEPSDRTQAVTVAYVHESKVSFSWHHSMIQLLAWDLANHGRLYAGGFISINYGTDGLVEARNQAVREFLADDRADWLFWLDTDMGFAPDTLDRLFAAADPAERPIVGALCFGQRELKQDGMGGHEVGAVPTIYDWARVTEGGQEREGFIVRWDYAPDTLTRCAATGSACVLIHRSVLERMAQEHRTWYARIPNPSTGQLIGEDMSFCMRAGAHGFAVFVHTGILTSHHKEQWVSERDYWRQRAVDPPPVTPEQVNGKAP